MKTSPQGKLAGQSPGTGEVDPETTGHSCIFPWLLLLLLDAKCHSYAHVGFLPILMFVGPLAWALGGQPLWVPIVGFLLGANLPGCFCATLPHLCDLSVCTDLGFNLLLCFHACQTVCMKE